MEPVSFGQLPVDILNHIIGQEAIRIPVINDDEERPLGLRPRDICLPKPIAPTRLRVYDYLADLYDPSCVHSRDSYPGRIRPRSQSRGPLVPLVNGAVSVLKQLEANSLDSFSWHTGTCLPAEVFGEQGILSLRQPCLRSLSIISSSACQRISSINLLPFESLRSLSWSDASPYNLEALATAIQINASRLETLEVNFINWPRFWYIVEGSDEPHLRFDETGIEDDDDGMYICEDTYFEDEVLGQMRNPLQPMFPVLRSLALTQVHLSNRTILTLNIGALESLTIRWCDGWVAFLRSLVELGVPLDLDHFQLQGSANHGWDGEYHALLARFIECLSEPKSLSLGQLGTHSSHGVWNRLVQHQKSIRRFVHQLNTKVLFDGSSSIQAEHLTGEDWDGMRQEPFRQNPFANFESLEFLGVTCEPAKMKILTMPFVTKSCLRVIHIRRTLDCILSWRDWLLTEGVGDSLDPYDESKEAEFDETCGPGETNYALKGEFRDFAEWVFGPDGIHSLKTLVFGDLSHISHTRRFSRDQVVLVRDESESGSRNFKMVDRDEAVFMFNLGGCLDAIEACPKCTLTKMD
ncbi:unnamed protein product [Clonostachys chloroleuca]|uniref:Uncharacterized protein n=1 Tax=Clonostachys chloroleuca TaxID=1926264 RepID=A0AA35M0Q5_9HYPO|nr:unnamed protein product [Clonostachys chloroleuca]